MESLEPKPSLDKFGEQAEARSQFLGEAARAYKEARLLVDAGLATMQVNEAGDSVEIKDAKGSIIIVTDKYVVLERAYAAHVKKNEKDMMQEKPGERSH